MTTKRFLDRLFDGCEQGYVELRALPTKHRAWTTPGQWTPFGPFITDEVRERQNVYIGIATRRDTTNGKTANLAELPALFVDFDRSAGSVREQLEAFRIRPTLIVESGLGQHCYWKLREPLDLQAPGALNLASALLRRLCGALGGDRQASSLANCLRVPNTWNFKYGTPRPVRLIETTDTAVTLAELDEYLPAEIVVRNTLIVDNGIHEGYRNDTLYRLTRSLRARGCSTREIVRHVEAVNAEHCQPPLEADEVFTLIRYALVQPDRPDFIPYWAMRPRIRKQEKQERKQGAFGGGRRAEGRLMLVPRRDRSNGEKQ